MSLVSKTVGAILSLSHLEIKKEKVNSLNCFYKHNSNYKKIITSSSKV